MHRYRLALPLLAWFAFAALAAPAAAEKKYDPGVSDSGISSARPCPIAGAGINPNLLDAAGTSSNT